GGGGVARADPRGAAAPRGGPRLRPDPGAGRAGRAGGGEEGREARALPRRGLDMDLSAEQPGDLARDGQSGAGPAVAPGRRAVRLLEGLEDELQLVVGDPDAGVGHLEADDLLGLAERLLAETHL